MNSSESKLQLFKDGVAPPTAHSRRTGGPSPKLLILKGLALLMLLSAAACGSSGPGEPGGGQPGNPSVVDGGKTVCKLDTDCKRVGGICKKEKDAQTGVCANPEAGCQNTRCLVGYECDQAQNKCIESKCETPCARGVCSKTTENQCVSKSSCTVSGEATDCIEGMYCYVESGQTRGTCKTEGEIGDELGCGTLGAPGVYDPTRNRTACVDALRCQKDEQCTSRRCVKVGTTGLCEKDFCAPPDVCKDGGACMNDTASPTGYTCKSKATCESQSDCAKPDICIKENGSSSGQCKSLVDACSVGCSGKRVCSYDESASKVKCEESGSCDSNLDCNPGRICTAGSCVAGPATCPNDSTDSDSGNDQANAKKYIGVKGKTQYICGDDADYVKYEYKGSQPGTLIIRVVLDASNYQGRVIKLTVTDSSGDSVVATNKNGDGTLSRAFSVTKTNVPSNEEFTIGVMAEDGSALNHVAIGYQLSVTEVDAKSVDICKDTNIEELANDGTIKEGYFNGKTGIASSCVNVAGYFYSQVYKLEIDKRSYTSIQLAPDGGANLGLSVRRSCYDKLDEVPHGCVDKDSSGGTETFGEVLDPGMYYVVVTGNSVDQNASYHISAKSTETICTPTTVRECTSGGRIKMCGTTQTDWEYDDCNLKGCSVQGGQAVCNGPQGDTCANPEVVTAGHDIVDKKITLDPLRNSYVAGSTCVDVGPSKSSGKDYVFSAVVKPGEALAGTIKDPGGAKKSAYIVKDCSNLNTCLATASDKAFTKYDTEALSIFWKNTGATDETVFLVIDYEDPSDRPVPTEFTVNLRVGKPICEPNQSFCPNGNKIVYCNALGSGYSGGKAATICSCQKGAYDAKCTSNVQGDICTEPAKISFTGNTYDSSAIDPNSYKAVTDEPAYGCGTIPRKTDYTKPEAKSPDYILELTPEPDKSYQITVTPLGSTPTFQPVIWIGEEGACNSTTGALTPTSSCIDGDASQLTNPVKLTFKPADISKKYFIVVSSYSKSALGDFKVEVVEKDVVGAPYSIKGCNTAGDAIVYYDKTGAEKEHKCTCIPNSKVCTTQKADSCYDAEVLYDGTGTPQGSVTGKNLAKPANKNSIGKMPLGADGHTLDRCLFSGDQSPFFEYPSGVDQFYKFVLQHKGDILTIDFTDKSTNHNSIAPFLQEGDKCGDPTVCFGTIGGRGTQVISYEATKDNDEIFFVLKYAGPDAYSYTYDYKFDWKIVNQGTLTCTPNSRICDSTDTTGKRLKVCDSTGATETSYTCVNGCADGKCLAVDNGATCANDAIDAGRGGVFLVDDTNSTSNSSPTCVTTAGGSSSTNSTFFKVEVDAGQKIEAYAATVNEGSHNIYIFKDCNDISGTCYGAAKQSPLGDPLYQNGSSISYTAQKGGTYYIGVTDSGYRTNPYMFYVAINVIDSECNASTPLKCDSGNKELTYCDNGKLTTVACNACNSNGSCDDGKGEVCPDATVLTGTTGTLTGESITKAATKDQRQFALNSGIVDNCMFDSELSGPEKFYSVELKRNDVFKASITNASDDLRTYLMSSCAGSCLSVDEQVPGLYDRKIKFVAPTDGTYIFVVDSVANATPPLSYDLTWSKSASSGTCEPYTTYCVSSLELSQCTPDGNVVSVTCECKFGRCVMENDDADKCATAPLVTDGYTTIIPFANYSHDLTIDMPQGCTFGSLGYYKTVSNDAYFRIVVPRGKTLTVSSVSSEMSGRTGLYILKECTEATNVCLKRSYTQDGGRTTLNYTASKTEEVYVGVSYFAYSPPSSPVVFPRSISFNISGEPCDATTYTPSCDPTSGKLTYCDPLSSIESTYTCASGCTSGSTTCTTPSGAACVEAISLTSGTKVSGDLNGTGISNTSPLVVNNLCTYEEEAGNDIVYKIEVPASQTLKVDLVSTATTKQDLALYVTKDCYKPDDASASCMGSDVSGGNDESVTVSNSDTTPTTYYIYVDSKTTIPAGDGTFDLTATVTP